MPEQETGDILSRCAGCRLAGEKVASSRKPNPRDIQSGSRKTVRFFQAEDLLAQADEIAAVGICNGCGLVGAIVDRINPGQSVMRRNNMIQSHGSKVFANGL